MKIYKRVLALLLVLCIFATDNMTTFAKIIEDERNQKEASESIKEIFEYPKANEYSKKDSANDMKQQSSALASKEQEGTTTETLIDQNQDEKSSVVEGTSDSKDETQTVEIETSVSKEETEEQSKEKETTQEDKTQENPAVDTSKEQTNTEETSQQQDESTQGTTEEKKEQSVETSEDTKKIEEQSKSNSDSKSEEQELEYPIIEEEEKEFEELYGEPIQVTQYTKVYKTAEGSYKTVYSDIPNTFVDSNGEEKVIDNTLEPINEKKETENTSKQEKEEKTVENVSGQVKEEVVVENNLGQTKEEKAVESTSEKIKEEKAIKSTLEKIKEKKAVAGTSGKMKEEKAVVNTLKQIEEEKAVVNTSEQVEEGKSTENTSEQVEEEKATENTSEQAKEEKSTENTSEQAKEEKATENTSEQAKEEKVVENTSEQLKEEKTVENTSDQAKEENKTQETQTDDSITAYTNASNNLVVTLPANGNNSNGISLSKDGFSITLYPIDGDYTKEAVKENAILYNQVFENINIQYTVEAFGVKEDIILNERTDKNEYTYRLSKDGIRAELIDNVVYLFKEEDKNPSMTLEAPIMEDATGAESEDITLDLKEEEENYIVTLTPNKEWLDSKERVYPVYIDPSITNIDNEIVTYSICTNSNFLSDSVGYVGYSDEHGKSRSYIIIGYSFNGIIPVSAVITSAKLNLYQYGGNEKGTISCYRLEKALNHAGGIDGMTWSSTVNINREIAGEKSNFKSKKGKHEIDIRDTVSRWVQGLTPVHGLVLIADNETKTSAEFYTNESSGIKKNKKPTIVIDWKKEGELDENAYSLDDTTVNLRTLIESNINGKHLFYGVYADGEAKPGASINYELNDTNKNFNSSVLAGYFKVFPNSKATDSLFPSATTKYKDKLSNWQTMLPFVDYDFNVLYQISATASKDGATGKKADSETFLIYRVTQFDTMPAIAKYYGVPLSKMLFDNKAADTLVVKNNTLFIRNPKKNANKPYNPPKLDDDAKAQIDSLLMGRGLHCEYGFEPINLNTGNFYMEQTDASITDETKEFAITRNYNSKGAEKNSYFGRGWQFEYEEKVAKDENGNVIYSKGDGSSMVFQKNGGNYVAPEGYDYSLVQKEVGTRTIKMGKKDKSYQVYEYTITDHSGTKRVFNEFGYLTKITDSKGNSTTLTYDGNYFIQKISTSSGFTYNVTCNDNGNITAIQIPDGQTLTYGYDDKENLTSFTDENGITIRYSYDDQHRMTEWYDGNGTRVVNNTYDGEGRVTRQIDANEKTSTLTYQDGKTITTDGNGQQTVYYYDEQYRTTGISYPNGTSLSRTYSGNQMTSETDVLGHKTTYEYDGKGNITKQTRYDGASKTYTYNSQNLILSETDYAGNQTSYEYDGKSNLTKVTQPENQVVSYTYDGNNHLIEMRDSKGNKTTLTYQGLWVHTITDAKGGTQTLSYNNKGKITSVTDKAGNATTYQYDNAGRKVKEVNAAGKSTDYTYDNAGNITSITDPSGSKTTFTHDGNGNIKTLTDPMGRVYQYEYDALGNKTQFISPLGEVSSYSYDSMGNNTSITNAQGKTTRYEYDALGNVVKEIDANGNVTTYDYDYRDNQVSLKTDPAGAQIATTYSATGLPTQQIDANGNQIGLTYDAAGRIKTYQKSNGLTTEYVYDPNGNIMQSINSDGSNYQFTYDTLNQMTSVTLPNKGTIQYAYDAMGHMVKQIDALGNETKCEYDKIGKIIAMIDANGNRKTYEYDNNSNLTQTTDPLGNTTKNIYDSMNQLTKLVDQKNYVTEYSYDAAGNISVITDALNGKTSYEFDKRGLVTKVTDAQGNIYQLEYDGIGNNTKIIAPDQSAVQNTYDNRNLLIKSLDSEGLETTYQYDKKGQLLKEENNAGDCSEYTYDAMGNITSFTNTIGQKTVYTYDVSGNLIKVVTPDGNQSQYAYDKIGNVIKITDPEGKVTNYQYDKNNQLISQVDDSMRTYQYTYDKLGNLTSDINPLGEKNSYEYDKLGNLTSNIDAAGNTESYEYDSTGNLITNIDKNGNKTNYTYDALGQVIAMMDADEGKQQYLYDALGNLIKYQDALGNVTNYTYDSVSQLINLTTPNGGTYEYTYDGHGNTTSITDPLGAVTKMVFDQKGQTTKRILPNEAEYSYAYDALGRLTKIEAPENQSKQYEYDTIGNLVKETDQAGRNVSYSYDEQHRLLTTTNEENATTSYMYDELGNLSTVVSPLGGKTTFAYDVLDRITAQTDPVGKVTELTYDIVGNLTKTTENGGRSTEYGYDAVGNQTTVTNALNQTTKYEFDKKNQVNAVIDSAGQKTSYEYDKVGQITAIIDAKEKSLNLTYDGNGNITSVMDAEGRTTTNTYDLADRLVKVTDGENIETLYTYDKVGNLSTVTDGNNNTTTYSHDLLGRVTSSTNPLGEVQEFTYDVEGRLKEEKQPDGNKVQYDYNKLDQLVSVDYGEENKKENLFYAYDGEGRRISMEDVTGTTSYEYDEAGQICLIKTSDGKEILYSYDEYGNLSKLTYPDGKTVTYTYDDLDRLTVLTDRNKKETHYTYDEKGNLTEIKRPNQTTTKLEYDVLNQVTNVENLDAKGKILSTYSYTYDNSGFITTEEEKQYVGKEKLEVKSNFIYDLRGQLTKVKEVQDGKETDIRYTYDKAGNRICIEKSEETARKQLIENQYNEANRLVTSADSIQGKTTYEYDKNGNLKQELAPGEEVVTYHYDVENRLNSVTEQGTLLMAALYDGDGNRIFKVEKKSSNEEENIASHNDFVQGEQNEQKQLEMDTYQGFSTWNKFTENLRKTFIRTDTKTTVTKTTPAQITGTNQTSTVTSTVTNTEESDKNYAPTTEIEESKLYVDPSTHFFWYGFGQGVIQGFTGAPQYLSAWFHDSWDYITNQYYIVRHIKTTEYVTSDLEDKTAAGVEIETHQTHEASTQTSISQSDPSITTNTDLEIDKEIDKEKQSENESALVPDKELEKLSGYEKVLYDTVLIPSGTSEIERDNYIMTSYVNDVNQENAQVLMEYDVNNEVASVYDYGVQRNSYTNLRADASQTQYYVYDGQGSVSSLTSVHGNPVVSYQYDAYGEAKVSGETYSPYQYNAEPVDTNTGLQYLRARYYNSSTGGFITQDTYAGTIEDPLTQNLYTYTGNNPINFVDPSGHKATTNPFSKRDRAPKRERKISAGIENILPTPGAMHIYSTPKAKVPTYGDYLLSQMEYNEPVDPVISSLESRYGTVTKKTDNYAYADGKFVTAFSLIEQKMCEVGNNIKANIQNTMAGLPEPMKVIAAFLKGFGDAILINYTPVDVNASETSYQRSYYGGKLVGDAFSILDMINAVISGRNPGGSANGEMLAGAYGGGSVAIAAEGEMTFSTSLLGNGAGGMEEDFKKFKEAIEKAKKMASEGGSKTGKNGTYEKADYHGKTNNAVKNKAPNNGQEALDNSISIGKNTTRRVGISDGEIVVLDETTKGVFHGHVRSWSELSEPMKAALKKAGMVTKKGKIIK